MQIMLRMRDCIRSWDVARMETMMHPPTRARAESESVVEIRKVHRGR